MEYQQREERRTHKRYLSELTVHFKALGGDSAEHEGIVCNVSFGGAFLRAQDLLPVGSELRLLVNIVTPFGEERQIEAEAKVMWVSQNSGEWGMGLNFTKVSRHSQYALLACAYREGG
jgi:hypothetical protein